MKFAHILNGLLRTVSNRTALTSKRRRRAALAEQLEARTLLSGNSVANPDTYYDAQNGAINIPSYAGVLANDTGGNGPLSAVLISGPSHGTLSLHADGSLNYTNTSMAMMGDSFQYEAFDGTNYSSPATASISFMGTYQPQVQSGNYSVLHDHALNVAAPGVLAGSSDPNHIHLTAVLESNPTRGTVTVNADGSFVYTPSLHDAGPDTFGIAASDGNQTSTTATEQITVTDIAPTASNVTYALANSQTFNVSAANGVLSSASDGDGDSMTATLAGGPNHGSLSLNADGSFSYTPTVGWVGQDSFSFTVSDGVKTSATATAFLNTQYSVLSAVDQTKVPVDTIQVGQQILSDPFGAPLTSPLPAGGSGGTTISAAPADGAPATAHNLSLIYSSMLAQPDQVIEADIGLSNTSPMAETLTATLTFNGVQQSPHRRLFLRCRQPPDRPHVHFQRRRGPDRRLWVGLRRRQQRHEFHHEHWHGQLWL